jgi:hypothetical protein
MTIAVEWCFRKTLPLQCSLHGTSCLERLNPHTGQPDQPIRQVKIDTVREHINSGLGSPRFGAAGWPDRSWTVGRDPQAASGTAEHGATCFSVPPWSACSRSIGQRIAIITTASGACRIWSCGTESAGKGRPQASFYCGDLTFEGICAAGSRFPRRCRCTRGQCSIDL